MAVTSKKIDASVHDRTVDNCSKQMGEETPVWRAKKLCVMLWCIVTSPNLAGPLRRSPPSAYLSRKKSRWKFLYCERRTVLVCCFFKPVFLSLEHNGEFSRWLAISCAMAANLTCRKSKLYLVPRPLSRLREPLSCDSPETSILLNIHSNELENIPGLLML